MRRHRSMFPGNGGAASGNGRVISKLQSPLLLARDDFDQVGASRAWSTPRCESRRGNVALRPVGWHTSARGHPDRSATTAVLEHGWEDRLCSIKPRCGRCPRPTVSDTTEPATVRTR